MKKTFILLMALVMLTVVFVQAGQAQLINYNRRQKKPPAARAAKPAASTYAAPAPAKKMPLWMTTEPKVSNRYEKLYDTDRNGRLDDREAKELLADVVSDVNRRGQVRISTNILREYDINKDGKISSYEVSRIAFDLRQ